MVEWLENPRKAPRVRLRLDASVRAGAAAFAAHTEDLGWHGCQLVAPQRLPRGVAVSLELRAEESLAPLHVGGAVAWASARPPWRLGVAFDASAHPAGAAFFVALASARPGLDDWQRVPDRISLDALVWLAPPPRLVVDFTADEVAVLRAVGSGASVYELRSRLRGRWQGGARALFSLLAGRHVTLSRGGAVPFANWSSLLNRLEAELAVGSLAEAPTPVPEARRPAGPPAAPPASPGLGRSQASAPAVELNDGSAGLDLDPEALRSYATQGLARRARSREATEAFQQGLVELAAGRKVSALALLRAALALAPGDLEIARKVGEVASATG